ncbi:MAG: SEC-C domain-containing protein [Chloroflexi bacterium]|nr:SEC-C domain-containing protein [Chloroflexota bacterium]
MPSNLNPPAPATKPGRNDPCWCGSGKKYKNCHLIEDARTESRIRLHQNLWQRLDEYALSEPLREDFKTAFKFFCGYALNVNIEDEDDLVDLHRALDYFVHDYRLPNGQRVIARFLAEHGKRLSPEERALVNNWLDSRLTAFEVIELERGSGMRVRDLVSGEEFDVRERRGTEQASRWGVIVTRLLRGSDHYELGGVGLNLPPQYRDWLRGHIAGEWSRYRFNHPEATYPEFLHASSQLLNRFIVDEIEPAMSQPPTLVTMEGDLTEFIAATFDVLDHTLVLAGLRGAEEFTEDTPEGAAEEQTFAWFESGESLELLRAHGPAFEHKEPADAPEGGTRVLAHLRLTREELRMEVTSRRRLEAGKELLAKRVGSALSHRGDEIKSVAEALAKLPETEPEEEEPAEEMPEQLEALQAQIAARIHREWVDQKVPALDGLTPREAVKTVGGRVRVIRLLKEFEARESVRARAGEIAYDFAELRNALGLTEQEFLEESRIEDQLKDALEEIETLAHADRMDDALAAWRAWRQKYPIATLRELEFSEIWDLQDVARESMFELANRLAMFKRFDEGIALLQEYLALDPEDPLSARAEIAEMRIERGEIETGLPELMQLVQDAPENLTSALTLAGIQQDILNRPEDALATLQRARAAMDDEIKAAEIYHEIIETYLAAGRADDAEKFWHVENDNAEEKEKDYVGLTRIKIAQRGLPQARESATKIQNKIARPHWLGKVEAMLGNYSAARKLWKGLLKDPEFDEWVFWFLWIEYHLYLRDFDRVIEKIDPVKMRAAAVGYFEVAIAHAAKGDVERAAEWVRAGRAEMERHARQSHFVGILRDARTLAEHLQIPEATQHAMGL